VQDAPVIAQPRVVLVVDDDEGQRRLIVSVLASAGFDAHSAKSGESALAAVAELRPSAVVLDVQLPGISGYEVCRRIREERGDEIGIIFVSGIRPDPIDRVAGLLLGADDYLAKPFVPDELTARVRRLVSRSAGHASSNGHASENGRQNGRNGHAGAARATGYGLTDRELEVLDLLANGLDQPDVARKLVVSTSTVATHIQHILGKLDVHNRAQAVALAHREGLVDPWLTEATPRTPS
jgi:DNA-binding NarL/FixJ family response regulator